MPHSRSGFWFSLLLLSLILAACGGLSGEPQIVATVPPRPTALPERGFPLAAPDVVVGAQIFVERCARCHGETGNGDSEFVRGGQLPAPPPDMTDPQTARPFTPKAWFDVITEGRLDKLMPPWRDSLSEADRWAVALYTYTLAYSPEQITNGQAIWSATCAACHGESGQADGPRAGEFATIPDLTDASRMVSLSDAALLASLDTPPHDLPEVTATEREAATAYLRTLLVANADAIGSPLQMAQAPAETQEAQPSQPAATVSAEEVGVVSGTITFGTTGASDLPADLTVTLHVVDNQFNEDTFETTPDSSGAFTFTNVPIRSDRGYAATVVFQGRFFASQFLTGDPANPSMSLPITLYEVTNDPSVIRVVGMVTQIATAGGDLQIAQVISFTNTSDKLFSGDELGPNGPYASVRVPLPPGAQLFDMGDTGQQLVMSDDGSAMIDTSAVLPGAEHIVHILFALPHDGSTTLDQQFDYAFDGPMRILLDSETLTIASDLLPSIGPQTVGSKIYNGYGAQLNLEAGAALSYEIRGDIAATGAAPTANPAEANTLSADRLLPIVFIVLGVLAVLAAAFLYWRGRTVQAPTPVDLPASVDNPQALVDGLIRQLAELDEQHAAGQITEKVYQKRRLKLKTRLAELLDKEA